MGIETKSISPRIEDLSGKIFGEWTVKEFLEVDRNGSAIWLCVCSCGKEFPVRGAALLQNKSSKCYLCSRRENGKTNRKDSKTVATNLLYRQYKQQAKDRDYAFDLDRETFEKLIFADCKYCGKPPSNVFSGFQRRNESQHDSIFYNGIDRIDNTKGYEASNCVTSCFQCNHAKATFTEEQFITWVRNLYNNMFLKHAEKTPGVLLDELFTTNYKLWWEQEKVMHGPENSEEVLRAAKKTQELNAKRNRLIRTIDDLLGFYDNTFTAKTYASIESNLEKDNQ